ADPFAHATHRRRSERIRHRRRRAHLPGQGRADARGTFPRDGATPGCLAGGTARVGSAAPAAQRTVAPVVGGYAVKVAFLGATKGMGRALARLMAARGDRLVLLGRDANDLDRSARDLEIFGAMRPVGTVFCDLLRPESFGPALDQAAVALGGIETVVV